MENGETMTGELYPEIAPKTVENFVNLIKKKFYDEIIFHRVIKDFMIQGGDPLGFGIGGSKERIFGEFTNNGFQNDLKHTRGVLSMARAADPNSASSQFFICLVDCPHLDGDYATFGKLTDGYDTLDHIGNCKTGFDDRPLEHQCMKTIELLDEA